MRAWQIWGLLLGVVLVSSISLTLTRADKRIGVSPPNYDYVPVTPHSLFSGQFTVFNQGEEELAIYAEYRNAPGNVTIEWQHPDQQWKATPEIRIPAKEHRYGRFTILLGALVQGQFYNWSIVCGYIETDPKVSVIAQAGFRINMIYPFPPPPPPKWFTQIPWFTLGIFIGLGTLIGGVIIHIHRWNKRKEPYHIV